MLNHIVIMGRLAKDPELRRSGSGYMVTNFTVAVGRDFPNKDTGELETDFINCVAWRHTGEFVKRYFPKGSLIVVSGRLQIRNWTDKDGNKRTTSEIVVSNVYFGGSKKEQPESTIYDIPSPPNYGADGFNKYGFFVNDPKIKPAISDFDLLDDDDAQLPF